MNQDPMGGQNFQQPINEPPASPQPASPVSPSQGGPAGELGGWAPAAEPVPAPMPPPPPPPTASNPFETTPPPVPPVSGPMSPMGDEQGMMESGSRKSSLPLIGILALLLIIGGLVFASWMNWISLGGIEKLWGGGKTPVVEPTPEPTPVTTNVNDAKRKEDLSNLKTALKQYYTATQSYPVAATTEKTLDSVALKVLVPDYITALPVDPLSPTYYYGYKSDGITFELTCILEDKTDTSGILTGDILLYEVTDISTETPTSSSSTTTTPTTNTNQ